MFRAKFLLGAALFFAPVYAQAESPVVVELYTSQGCSSCPPADRLLAELATHDYVIALALHVDYWDYLGWKDKFAKPEFSDRQRLYARQWGERSVYTPQMVVQGVKYMVGSRADEIQRQIMQFEDAPDQASLRISHSTQGTQIRIAALAGPLGEAEVYLVGYSEGETVRIERGENAGQIIEYVNVVDRWETLGRWDGSAEMVLDLPDLVQGKYVVIVQALGPGEIYVAARLTR